MLYLAKRNDDVYITEDRTAASKLSKNNYESIGEVALTDVVAYFVTKALEKKVEFSPHPTFKRAYKTSNPRALDDYLNEAKSVLSLDLFNPKRVEWETQRVENLKQLDRLSSERRNRNN